MCNRVPGFSKSVLLSGSKLLGYDTVLQVDTKVPEENPISVFRVEADESKKYEMEWTCSTQGMVSKYSSWSYFNSKDF
jgi:hypothetical protein